MKQKILHWTSISQSSNAENINLLIITAIWILMVILVNPIGDFPLNDDWAYGKTVQFLVQKGDFQLSGWAAINLFSQVFWGALFCLPFGFSFTALRFATLALGLIGVITTYKLVIEVYFNHKMALFGALVLAFNPIYFGLSNTFMTDVPFFAFAILSIYFLIRGLKHDSIIETITGIFFACVSLLIRQLGFAIFLAFGCAYVIKTKASLKSFTKGFSPTILAIFIQTAYQQWLQSTTGLPKYYGKQIQDILNRLSASSLVELIEFFMKNTLIALLYTGLFMLIFTIGLLLINYQLFSIKHSNLTLLASLMIFIVFGVAVRAKRFQIPITRNVLSEFGLGPLTLRDGFILNNLSTPTPLKIFWLFVTILSILGATLLAIYLFLSVRKFWENYYTGKLNQNWLIIFIFSAISIYLFPLGIGGFFDRYLIFLLPLLMMLVAVCTPTISQPENLDRRLISIVIIMMLFSGWFTVGATHDYLSWNRVRWQALGNLMQEANISPNNIDGGFEFNGWYLYSPKYKGRREKSWWWVDKDDYIISFGSLAGYKELKRYPVNKWLPFGPTNILVSRKITASSGQ